MSFLEISQRVFPPAAASTRWELWSWRDLVELHASTCSCFTPLARYLPWNSASPKCTPGWCVNLGIGSIAYKATSTSVVLSPSQGCEMLSHGFKTKLRKHSRTIHGGIYSQGPVVLRKPVVSEWRQGWAAPRHRQPEGSPAVPTGTDWKELLGQILTCIKRLVWISHSFP